MPRMVTLDVFSKVRRLGVSADAKMVAATAVAAIAVSRRTWRRCSRLRISFRPTDNISATILRKASFLPSPSLRASAALVAQRDAERRRDQSEDLIGFMVGDLRTQLKPVGRLETLRSVGDKALEYFASLDASDATPEVLLRRGQSLHQLGGVYLDLGEWNSAIEAFAESLGQIKTLHRKDPSNPDFVFELSQAEFWMGNAYMVPYQMLPRTSGL